MHRPHRAEVQETRSSGQYDQGGERDRRSTPEGIPDNGKHGHGPQNRHVERREASVSFSLWKRRRLEQDAARRSWRADPGASPALVRPSAHPTPRGGKCGNEAIRRETAGRKENEEDEVGDRETDGIKIVGWVERRRPARARAKPTTTRAAGPGASALDPTCFALRRRAIRRAV